jgi:two-component system response regulator FixJ
MGEEGLKRKILIVEDDDLARDALVARIARASFPVQSFDSAQALLDSDISAQDAVVTDVRMEPMDGLELTRRLRERFPSLAIVVMSSFADVPMAVGAMKLGACDFVDKTAGPDALIAALEALEPQQDQGVEVADVAAKLSLLTPREMEIFQVVGKGMTTPQISERLGISRRTVDAHRRALMAKLDAPRLGHLVRMATVAGLN